MKFFKSSPSQDLEERLTTHPAPQAEKLLSAYRERLDESLALAPEATEGADTATVATPPQLRRRGP